MAGRHESLIEDHAVSQGLESPENAGSLEGSANSQVGLDKAQEILRLHVGKTKQGPYPVCSTLSRMVWRSGRRE